MSQTAGCPKATWSYTIIRFVVKESTWSTRRFTFSILPKEATKFFLRSLFAALAVFNNYILLCSDWRHSFNVNHLSSNLCLAIRVDFFLEFFEWVPRFRRMLKLLWLRFLVLSTNAQIKSKHMAGLRLLSFFPQEVVQLTTNNAWKIYGKVPDLLN